MYDMIESIKEIANKKKKEGWTSEVLEVKKEF